MMGNPIFMFQKQSGNTRTYGSKTYNGDFAVFMAG